MANEDEIMYEIVDDSGNDFFSSLEEYIFGKNPERNDDTKNGIKKDITNLIVNEFNINKLQIGDTTTETSELIPTINKEGGVSITKGSFSITKTEESKIRINNSKNFLGARVRKGLDSILPRDPEKLKTIILGTFPGVDTLNENAENPGICYYLNSRNIFRLILGIIYDHKFNNTEDNKSKNNGDLNPAIETYLEISKKKKSDNISNWQQEFINEVGTIGIWDAVHICYIKQGSSKDNSRVCLATTGLSTDGKKILFNGKKNKLNKFVHQESTFGETSNYIFCSSTSGNNSSSKKGLILFEWAYNLLIDKNNNLTIINKTITKILKKYFKWAYRILLNRHHNKITNQLNVVNKNLIHLIKKYKTKGNEDFVKTLYSMMALFNIGYAYEKNTSYNKVINYVINKFEKEEKDKLSKNFKKELIKKLTENVKSFLTGEMDDEDIDNDNEKK